MEKFIKILSSLILFAGLSMSSINAFAQNPVCAYCGTQLPNGVHSSTCRYYVATANSNSTSASSGTSSPDLKTMVAGAIMQNVLKSMLSNKPENNQKELEAKQRAAAFEAQLAAQQAAEQQRANELRLQAEHEKMMRSFKSLDGTRNLQNKTLGNTDSCLKRWMNPMM